MTTERDELADLYADILFRRHGIETSQSKDAADELIEAGYRKPRTVTTAAELDALPVGSVVLDGSGDTWQSYAGCERPDGPLRTYWECGEAVEASDDFAFPATVLHEPTR